MKRPIALFLLIFPATALAHGPASIYYLIWWYIIVFLGAVSFVAFSSALWKRKFLGILGFIIVPAIVWATLGNIEAPMNSWLSNFTAIALGASPVLGLIGGMVLSKGLQPNKSIQPTR